MMIEIAFEMGHAFTAATKWKCTLRSMGAHMYGTMTNIQQLHRHIERADQVRILSRNLLQAAQVADSCLALTEQVDEAVSAYHALRGLRAGGHLDEQALEGLRTSILSHYSSSDGDSLITRNFLCLESAFHRLADKLLERAVYFVFNTPVEMANRPAAGQSDPQPGQHVTPVLDMGVIASAAPPALGNDRDPYCLQCRFDAIIEAASDYQLAGDDDDAFFRHCSQRVPGFGDAFLRSRIGCDHRCWVARTERLVDHLSRHDRLFVPQLLLASQMKATCPYAATNWLALHNSFGTASCSICESPCYTYHISGYPDSLILTHQHGYHRYEAMSAINFLVADSFLQGLRLGYLSCPFKSRKRGCCREEREDFMRVLRVGPEPGTDSGVTHDIPVGYLVRDMLSALSAIHDDAGNALIDGCVLDDCLATPQ
jgi:hypothetical protein